MASVVDTMGCGWVDINREITALAHETSSMLLKAKFLRCVGVRVPRLGVVLVAVFCARQACWILSMSGSWCSSSVIAKHRRTVAAQSKSIAIRRCSVPAVGSMP